MTSAECVGARRVARSRFHATINVTVRRRDRGGRARDRGASRARSLELGVLVSDVSANEHPLDPIFHPRATAIVGVSSRPSGRGGFLQAMMEAGYHDEHGLYPVNPKMDEVEGLRCYPGVLDCPDPLDHVISQIPADGVPRLVDQCIKKGVRSIHLYTAGFSETGDELRSQWEAEIVARARDARVRLIGPNCMGLYVPGVGLAFMGGFPREPGNVFLLSQSGANAGDIIGGLSRRGVRFSKAVSFGNGADLRAHHFFDYAADDPQSEVVIAYMEGIQDGRALFAALKRCAAVKPTIVLKGGLSAAGARAANSHTGSLAGSSEIFEALCRQTGAIRAEHMAELHDLVVALTTGVRGVRGTGVALVSGGGGFAVLSSDAIAAEGLDVPPLPEAAQDKLRMFVPVAGTSVRNPIDSNIMGGRGRNRVRDTLSVVASAEPIDAVFTAVGGWNPRWTPPARSDGDQDDTSNDPLMQGSDGSAAERARAAAGEIGALQQEFGVPFVAISRERGPAADDSGRTFSDEAYRQGIGVFPTVTRAARAVSRVLEWRRRREGLPDLF